MRRNELVKGKKEKRCVHAYANIINLYTRTVPYLCSTSDCIPAPRSREKENTSSWETETKGVWGKSRLKNVIVVYVV